MRDRKYLEERDACASIPAAAAILAALPGDGAAAAAAAPGSPGGPAAELAAGAAGLAVVAAAERVAHVASGEAFACGAGAAPSPAVFPADGVAPPVALCGADSAFHRGGASDPRVQRKNQDSTI